ncbi:MAG: hypothetical protein K1060chlam4_00381 [Candidatus Anoxychlamydiales bacterium]|nr:hypothetical protein [Candidatus Anoxychlamydiales bacterium]
MVVLIRKKGKLFFTLEIIFLASFFSTIIQILNNNNFQDNIEGNGFNYSLKKLPELSILSLVFTDDRNPKLV